MKWFDRGNGVRDRIRERGRASMMIAASLIDGITTRHRRAMTARVLFSTGGLREPVKNYGPHFPHFCALLF